MPSSYRRNSFDFVTNSGNFNPYQSLQEMLVPITAYHEAYDKAEEMYSQLADKAGAFEYLSRTLPEDSAARQIYEGYANDFNNKVADFSRNGLTMGNRRALNNLRTRYQGEIGRLEKADIALKEEQKARSAARAAGKPMLYASDNLDIDKFLDNKTPNLYGINSDDLYARGINSGKTASSRMYSADDEGSTLGGYYKKWVEKVGVSPENIAAFMQSEAVQKEVDDILREKQVTGNLTGANLEAARQSVLNGIYNGIIYQESAKPYRDEGRLTAAQRADDARQWRSLQLNAALHGMEWDSNKREFVYKPEKNPALIDSENELTRILAENNGKIPEGYQYNPKTRKLEKLPSIGGNPSSVTAEEKAANAKSTALLKMNEKGRDNFGSAYGFDVTFGPDSHHYDYVGLIEPGKEGYKNKDVESRRGKISISENEDMKALSETELSRVLGSDVNLADAFFKALEDHAKSIGLDPKDSTFDPDVQLIEIYNKKTNKKRYLIAYR